MKLKKRTHKKDPSVINVIDEFDFSTQNPSYNKAFIKWRSSKKNPYAYNYNKNPKETVYNDSRGFESASIAHAEKRVVTNIMHTIGIAMLMTIVIDSILCKLIVVLLDVLGFNIHTSVFSSGCFGGSNEVIIMHIFSMAVKIIIPMIYLHCKMKLPRRVELMSKLNSPIEVINSIALTLMACTAVSIPVAYSNQSQDLYEFFLGSGNEETTLLGQNNMIVYMVFYIIVLPVISELFFRGAIFAALRQFGDIFAIAVTSVTACLLTRDFAEMPAALIISVVASLGMLRSGTILTALFVRIIYRMYTFVLIILAGDNSVKSLVYRNTFMLATFVTGAMFFIILYLVRRSGKNHYLAMYKTHTPVTKRYTAAVSAFPYSVMAGICLLEALLKIIFSEAYI